MKTIALSLLLVASSSAAERLAWDYTNTIPARSFIVDFSSTNGMHRNTTTNLFVNIDFLAAGEWTALVTAVGTNGVTRTSDPFLLPVPERVANIRLQKAPSPNGPWTNVSEYTEPVLSNAFFRLAPPVITR